MRMDELYDVSNRVGRASNRDSKSKLPVLSEREILLSAH